jgi:hypothetical protein
LAARQLRESPSILPFEIQFPVHDVIKVDGSTNEYLIRATIQLDYQFEFLHWDANDTRNRYYDIDEIILTKSSLQSFWLPDMHFTDEDSISFNIEHESVKVARDGNVRWIRRGLFTIASTIDLTYYPFDHQYIRINMHNRQKTFKLQYQRNISPMANSRLARSSNLWTRLFGSTEINFNESNSSNISLTLQQTNQTIAPILSRGWFVRTLEIEPKNENGTSENLSILILIQRRREAHIYTTILPTLFFSVFIFIYYFSSIEGHQRLVIGLLHILATLIFIIYLDRRISAEQLSYSPLLIKYLSILFLIEVLSLFFDHIIHSIYYGGLHFVSNWLLKKDEDESQPARLSRVTLLTHNLQSNSLEHEGGTNVLMKQLIEREESVKFEDYQRYQWRKHARLSECLCCWFVLTIVIISFICIFFILPTLGLQK